MGAQLGISPGPVAQKPHVGAKQQKSPLKDGFWASQRKSALLRARLAPSRSDPAMNMERATREDSRRILLMLP